jgi:hypothetical protein
VVSATTLARWAGFTYWETVALTLVISAFMPRVRVKVGGYDGPRTYGPSGD